MTQILVEHDPSPMKLEVMAVDSWPVVDKPVSTFSRDYEQTQTCYIAEGHALVSAEGGEAVEVGEGDLVTLMPGLSCTWDIQSAMKIHYLCG
ncbi:MAG: cupin domain-containing protein [Gammaproteobacteria bacterium]